MSDAAGGTALHIAAAKSFPPVVRALLAAGADRGRSEERRVGTACYTLCRTSWAQVK